MKGKTLLFGPIEVVFCIKCHFCMVVCMTGSIQDVPTVLYVPLVEPCMNSEKLAISVDVLMGTYKVSMPNYSKCNICQFVENYATFI